MIFSIDAKFASLVKFTGVEISFEHAVERAGFSGQFPNINMASIRSLNYEPERNIYHIVELDWTLNALESPMEDPRMAEIHANIDSIDAWFLQQEESGNGISG